jgi:Flp pilus assembly protein TadG
MTDDDGSTLPLILGFFLVALLVVAGSVAAGDAFVQQRGLQDVCDGAATAAAASGVDLGRGGALDRERQLQFGDVARTVSDYLARDPSRHGVHVTAQLSPDRRTLTLTCEQTERIAFGAMFGKGDGVRHRATSSAQAPLA